jgi:hypothetical protein
MSTYLTWDSASISHTFLIDAPIATVVAEVEAALQGRKLVQLISRDRGTVFLNPTAVIAVSEDQYLALHNRWALA